MIQRIRFGTVEQVVESMHDAWSAENDYLLRLNMAEASDYILRLTGSYIDSLPAHPKFADVMSMTGAKAFYMTSELGDVSINYTRKSASDIKIANGRDFTGRNGRIFQLAHNIVNLAVQIDTGNEAGEFIDVSGTLPNGGNAFHF